MCLPGASCQSLESSADVAGHPKDQLFPLLLQFQNSSVGKIQQIGSGRLIHHAVQVLMRLDCVSPPRRFDRLDDQSGLAVVEQIKRADRRFSLPDLGRFSVDVGRQLLQRLNDYAGLGNDKVREIVVVRLGVEE